MELKKGIIPDQLLDKSERDALSPVEIEPRYLRNRLD
jgi:hypothetical protein